MLSDSQPRRKLSFSQDTEAEAERTETGEQASDWLMMTILTCDWSAGAVGASPGTDQLPGEMFMLDNITEEPDNR